MRISIVGAASLDSTLGRSWLAKGHVGVRNPGIEFISDAMLTNTKNIGELLLTHGN